ncbi:MAG TPA: hypothetical protein VGR61_09990 [Candidatus Dormibacteraeota bacterium]|nr:hypothetical protein [Candidatus Dormibacteraeota bacterium]
MGRNEFALGVLLGGLAGLAVGYVIRRGSVEQTDDLSGSQTIDLTPALARRGARADMVGESAGAFE